MVDVRKGRAREPARQGREGGDRVVTELSEVALVVAVARGHRDALAEVYRRHGAQACGRSVDRLRSDRAGRAQGSASALVRQPPVIGIESAPVTLLAGDEVWRLLSALPDGQRDAIVLASFTTSTCRDVGAVLEQPEATIKRRIRAGLTRLRLALSDEGIQSAGRLI